jgi:hypothetical protein
VLNSVFYVLLRLLRPHLVAAGQGQGGLASFPLGRIFVQVGCPAPATTPEFWQLIQPTKHGLE